MTWNYRIFRTDHDETYSAFDVREVFYDEDGKPNGYTAEAIAPEGDSVEDLDGVLEMMLRDIRKSRDHVLTKADFEEPAQPDAAGGDPK